MKKTFWPDSTTVFLLHFLPFCVLEVILFIRVWNQHSVWEEHIPLVVMIMFLGAWVIPFILGWVVTRYIGRIEINDEFVSGPIVGGRRRIPKNEITISERCILGFWKQYVLQHKNETISIPVSNFKSSTLHEIESLLRT